MEIIQFEDQNELQNWLRKSTYHAFVMLIDDFKTKSFEPIEFNNKADNCIINDVRKDSEVKTIKFFDKLIHIPLRQLRNRRNEIPLHKPILVHCASGYRNVAGSRINKLNKANAKVYDLREEAKKYI